MKRIMRICLGLLVASMLVSALSCRQGEDPYTTGKP